MSGSLRLWINSAALRVAATFFVFCVAVLCCHATPTTPVFPNVDSLPIWYLSNTTSGQVTISTSKPNQTTSTLLAKGRYNSSSSTLGWDYFHLETIDDTHASYFAAGYLEGWLGSESMSYSSFSTAAAPTNASADWINEHIAFLWENSELYRDTDPFWNQIGKLLQQIAGIAAGYNAKTGESLTFLNVFLGSFASEVGDVVTATEVQAGLPVSRTTIDIARNLHCSALIKITDDDLFVAHDTWSGFGGLGIRVYKVYDFAGKKVAMDSFPGVIASGTDWYVTAQHLAVQETTNIVFNTSLYTAVVPHTVSEFLRVMTANYLSSSGEEWSTTFGRLNSGTYNNQWMVVDFKVYESGTMPLAAGLLWISEQIPGQVVSADETSVLDATGYWASYNINFFPELYVKSGYAAMEAEQGTFWSYTKYARPEIFRRNQSSIVNMEGMQRMMRYNDWAVDPLSVIPNCTGADAGCATRHTSMLTIASRGDLMPVYNTTAENIAVYGPLYSWVAQGCFGAIDSKIASYKNRHKMIGTVICGPTNDQQPTFAWGENVNCPLASRPPGSPTTYNFPWVQYEPGHL